MKIGLSYSRCVLDIVEGRVNAQDVLVVIARTDFDPNDDKQWAGIWRGYTTRSGWSMPEWKDYAPSDQRAEALFRSVSRNLYSEGKLHQPRQFGYRPQRYPWHWLETMLPDSELESRPAVKEAWDQFRVVAGLSGVPVEPYSEH